MLTIRIGFVMETVLVCFALLLISCGIAHDLSSTFSDLRNTILKTKSKSDPDIQHAAVEDLIKRLFDPLDASRFLVEVQPQGLGDPAYDAARVTSFGGNVVRIVGNSGTACAFALYHFLKYHCGCQVSWSGRQLDLPEKFPVVSQLVKKADWLHYYQNVCTSSYSFAWWDWPRWEEEIDWMALQGVNFPLAFTGQEEIWRRVYAKHGLNDTDLESFFVGPAFLAWGRMGNIRRWAGPLSKNWLTGQLGLQHKILDRMTSLGMIPILPGFGGIIPEALIRTYPQLNYSRVESWAGFPDNLSSSFLLEPTENLYLTLGQDFITEMKKEFGDVTHFYNADSFNEQRPSTSAQTFIKNVADATYKGMLAADPDAIWVMQGWLFYYDSDFWTPELTKTLLTEAPLGRMIILDLDADAFPIYPSTQSFYGQPFIWCMLHNYGGVQGLYGRISHINKDPLEARNVTGSTMIGVGLSMEGINQNEVMYELMNEMSWRTQPVEVDEWMANFTDRRYGDSNDDAHQTYQILRKKVLDHPTTWANQGRYILTRRPHFNYSEPMWYDPKDVFKAFSHLLRAATTLPKTDMLLYDIVDLSRQSLQIVFHSTYEKFQASFEQGNVASARKFGDKLLKILDDMDLILSTNKQFSLNDWIKSARSWAQTPAELAQYKENALNQLTIWGPDGQELDYATKQWSGMVSRYYRPRWKLFITRVLDSLESKKPFDQQAFDNEVFEKVERPFTHQRLRDSASKSLAMNAINNEANAVALAKRLFEKYDGFRDVTVARTTLVDSRDSCRSRSCS